MILIGTTNLCRTRSRGQFHCLNCQSDQNYRLQSRRPFLTVYLIPLVPIGDAHGIVLCDECENRFDPSVLDMTSRNPAPVDREQFENEAMRAAILITMIDGEIDDGEVANLLTVGSHLAGMPIDREVLGLHTSIARENQIPFENYVPPISRRWNDAQKCEGLGAMFLAASAGGEVDEKQTRILSQLRDILNLTESQFQAAIEDALTWERPRS